MFGNEKTLIGIKILLLMIIILFLQIGIILFKNMLSKFNQRTSAVGQSLSRKKIVIPQIYSKSKQKKKSHYKRQLEDRSGTSVEYGTDEKKKSHNQSKQIDQLKDIMLTCTNCKNKISQFATKKPFHYNNCEKSIQTVHKPFLVDLIQERIESICRQNGKLATLVQQKQDEVVQRQQQLNQIQDKFTNIIYSLGQDLCYLKIKEKDDEQIKENLIFTTETPAYIKALFFDRRY